MVEPVYLYSSVCVYEYLVLGYCLTFILFRLSRSKIPLPPYLQAISKYTKAFYASLFYAYLL